MDVKVNGEAHRFEGTRLNVAELLGELEIEPKGVAVALNNSVVPRSKWDGQLVRDGDEVEIVRATQGG